MIRLLPMDAEDLITIICNRLSGKYDELTYKLEYDLLYDIPPYRLYKNYKSTITYCYK